ncbi:MAG: SdiA-regulated domain-containing protein [Bacteroidota bacterium]|nr:SdiA-regulated domain-containing protein [Bacteroidota bacterium]
MRKRLFFVTILICIIFINIGQSQTALRYKGIYEVIYNDDRFDVSGIVKVDSQLFIVADKPWNNFLYSIKISDNKAFAKKEYQLPFQRKIDLEGVDYCCNKFFMVDERKSELFSFAVDGSILTNIQLDIEKFDKEFSDWGNRSFEGVAIDKKEWVIFLGKERSPKRIFALDISTGVLSEPFIDFCNKHKFDIADMKCENGFLFILDRNNYRILKLNLQTGMLNSEFLYSHIMNCDNEKLYSKAKFPMSEGLLLLQNEIWIVLDNNAEATNSSNKYIKMNNLKGNNPMIVVFERPEEF